MTVKHHLAGTHHVAHTQAAIHHAGRRQSEALRSCNQPLCQLHHREHVVRQINTASSIRIQTAVRIEKPPTTIVGRDVLDMCHLPPATAHSQSADPAGCCRPAPPLSGGAAGIRRWGPHLRSPPCPLASLGPHSPWARSHDSPAAGAPARPEWAVSTPPGDLPRGPGACHRLSEASPCPKTHNLNRCIPDSSPCDDDQLPRP